MEEGKQTSHGRRPDQVHREIHQGPLHLHTCEHALEQFQAEMHRGRSYLCSFKDDVDSIQSSVVQPWHLSPLKKEEKGLQESTCYQGSVNYDQTGFGFEPVWRTTHLLTLNRKRFDHLIISKLKPVFQTDETTLGLVCPNICSLEIKMAAIELFHEIHCTKINCCHRGSCFLLFRLD